MIGVINYKAGNSQSVISALNSISVPSKLISSSAELDSVTHIILPGVGSADATMASLRELDLIDSLTLQVVEQGKPFLGICVGLQVLFETSEEGDVNCLGWLKGKVAKLKGENIRVPHIGWNTVTQKQDHPFFKDVQDKGHFYFVNSYYAQPQESANILATTDYGPCFPCIVGHKNILATQFHAEKSGEIGLQLLRNFYTL